MENCSSSVNTMPRIVRNKGILLQPSRWKFFYRVEIKQASLPGPDRTVTLLPEQSLSTTPMQSSIQEGSLILQLFLWLISISLVRRDTSTRTPMFHEKTSFDKQDVGFRLGSPSHLFSLWLRKHPHLPTDPFAYCTHNTSSSCYIHRFSGSSWRITQRSCC